MFEAIRYNIWIFFERIRVRREINKLKQELGDLCWHISVEKLDDPELLTNYKEVEAILFAREETLKGLQYA